MIGVACLALFDLDLSKFFIQQLLTSFPYEFVVTENPARIQMAALVCKYLYILVCTI